MRTGSMLRQKDCGKKITKSKLRPEIIKIIRTAKLEIANEKNFIEIAKSNNMNSK